MSNCFDTWAMLGFIVSRKKDTPQLYNYGTPYLPYDVYFHYIRWFFIICGGYIIIRGDLFIIFGTSSSLYVVHVVL